jgi:hypothetical protein
MRSAILAILVGALGIAGCQSSYTPSDLTSRLAEHPVGVRFELSSVVPEGWDRAYVIGAYQTGDTLESILCLRWPDAPRAAEFAKSDAAYLIVLVSDRSVTDWFTVNQNPGAAIAFRAQDPFLLAPGASSISVIQGPEDSETLVPDDPTPVPPCQP